MLYCRMMGYKMVGCALQTKLYLPDCATATSCRFLSSTFDNLTSGSAPRLHYGTTKNSSDGKSLKLADVQLQLRNGVRNEDQKGNVTVLAHNIDFDIKLGQQQQTALVENMYCPDSTEERKVFKHTRAPSRFVLDHFDRQYGRQFGSAWSDIKAALMAPKLCGILINNFADVSSDTAKILKEHELQSMSDLYKIGGKTMALSVNGTEETGKDIALQGDRLLKHDKGTEAKLEFYLHPDNRHRRFPNPRHVPGQLKPYYLQGAASLLPVLALDVQQGERVLDMCAAPGGKSLALLQTAELGHLTSNEPDPQRKHRLVQTLQSYIPQERLSTRVEVTTLSGVHFQHLTPNTYDKVLVDAPCSNDRNWLYNQDSTMLRLRMDDRRHLPQLQAALLSSALHAVKPGGSVVYATCTLSKEENDYVVDSVFGEAYKSSRSKIDVINLTDLTKNFLGIFRFDSSTRYGQLVLPHLDANWGPMYFAKLKKLVRF